MAYDVSFLAEETAEKLSMAETLVEEAVSAVNSALGEMEELREDLWDESDDGFAPGDDLLDVLAQLEGVEGWAVRFFESTNRAIGQIVAAQNDSELIIKGAQDIAYPLEQPQGLIDREVKRRYRDSLSASEARAQRLAEFDAEELAQMSDY
jgi:hypothetical protein